MNAIEKLIESQYTTSGLYEEIIKRLTEQDIDLKNVTRKNIGVVDEFHIRGAAVTRELVNEINFEGLKVLDVGCGIGGPSRLLADEFNCNVSGIDLSNEFIRTAQKLSELVKTNGSTNFTQGSALNLPYGDATFDMILTQHVQMNIEDKKKFYSEISRVLKSGGRFIYYDIFNINNRDVQYPVPWAVVKEASFLGSISNMENILENLGFSQVETKNQTEAGIAFFTKMIEKIKATGPPKLGLNVLLGPTTKLRITHSLEGLKTKNIELQSGIYIKK